jgi:hypothetical protein
LRRRHQHEPRSENGFHRHASMISERRQPASR